MILDRVTMTGADDSTHPQNLIAISALYPCVEWGILVSSGHAPQGSPRFPSLDWIKELQKIAAVTPSMKLSLHVCGQWTRDLLLGKITIPEWMFEGFQRVQLNFHAERTECNPEACFHALHKLTTSTRPRQFIFQIDGRGGNEHLEAIMLENDDGGDDAIDAVALFDISGGAGILPKQWPEPRYIEQACHPDDPAGKDHYAYHGYAGGLGPQNLAEQLPLIAAAAGETRVWIDMETHIRSMDDAAFDLTKVRDCLAICDPFVDPAAKVIR